MSHQFTEEIPEFTVTIGTNPDGSARTGNYAGFMLGSGNVSLCNPDEFDDWTEVNHCDPSKDTEYLTRIGGLSLGDASLGNAYDMRVLTSISLYCSSDTARLRHFYRDLRISPCGRIMSISEEYHTVYEDVDVATTVSIDSSYIDDACTYFTQIDDCEEEDDPPDECTTTYHSVTWDTWTSSFSGTPSCIETKDGDDMIPYHSSGMGAESIELCDGYSQGAVDGSWSTYSGCTIDDIENCSECVDVYTDGGGGTEWYVTIGSGTQIHYDSGSSTSPAATLGHRSGAFWYEVTIT